jgi:hypothetical protein
VLASSLPFIAPSNAGAQAANAGAQAASAQPGERVRIRYVAPSECPAEGVFLREVRARLSSDWEAPEGELARLMDVRVERDDDARYLATLRFTTPEGIAVRRVVVGKACESVVSGGALVAALAIEARLSETTEETAAETPPTETRPLTSAPRSNPVRAPEPVRARPPNPPARRSPPAAGSPWRVELGARLAWVTGVGPSSAIGPGAFVHTGPLPLKLGLSFDSVRSGNERERGVLASYELHSARLEAGVALPVTTWLHFDALGLFEAGSLSASAVLDPPTVVRSSRGYATWVAPGGAGRLSLRFDPWIFGIEGMARFPLVQEQFYVRIEDERRPVHRVPYFSAGVALALGAGF